MICLQVAQLILSAFSAPRKKPTLEHHLVLVLSGFFFKLYCVYEAILGHVPSAYTAFLFVQS